MEVIRIPYKKVADLVLRLWWKKMEWETQIQSWTMLFAFHFVLMNLSKT